MKKVIVALMVVVLCLGLSACGSAEKDKQIAELKEENAKLRSQVEELDEGTQEEITDDKESSVELEEIKVNEPFSVNTENGEYRLTINGAHKTDWWQRLNKEETNKNVIVLSYEVENVNFLTGNSFQGKDGVLLDDRVFRVSDDKGYVLQRWNTSYSDYGVPDIIGPGYKTRAELPYVIDGESKYIDVVFSRSEGMDLGKARVEITE